MDSPVPVRPAGNGPEGETGTTVRYQKTGGFLKPEGALIPPPKDAVQHRMGVEVHQALYSLKATLNTVGADEVLISEPGSYAIDISKVSCDYYRLLDGDENAAQSFMGEYMNQYSWAEETCGWLAMKYQGR